MRNDAIARQEHGLPSTRDLLLQRYYLHEEEDVHLRDYWPIILKHRWTVLTFFVIILTTVTIYTVTLPPTYKASATIQVERELPKILSFQDFLSVETSFFDTDYITTQQKLLQSRSLASRVADMLRARGQLVLAGQEPFGSTNTKGGVRAWLKNLFRRQPPTVPQAGSSNPTAEQAASRDVDALLGMLAIEPVKSTNLIRIAFTTRSPQLSALLANTWAEAFTDQLLELKYKAATQASDWLSKQLREVMQSLEVSEAKLQAFAREKGILTIGEKKDAVTAKLAELSEALAKAQSQRSGKESLYRQVQGLGFESIPVGLETTLISSLKAEYYKAENEYQRLSETYKPDYPKMVRMREGINQLKKRLDTEIRRVVHAIKEEHEEAVNKEKLLQAAVNEQNRLVVKLNPDIVQYDILKRDVDTNRQIYASILERHKQTGISQGLVTSNVKVVDRAESPTVPFSPNKTRNVLVGIIMGLTVGIGLAFFFDYLDNTVKSPEDLERRLKIPTLALIPTFVVLASRKGENGSRNGRSVFELVSHEDLRSVVTEAFRSLRTSILFSSPGSPPKSILLTSARPSEGKTGVAINTAITLSQLGGAVLLIDADMRRPACHKFLQVPLKPGLSDYLTGHADLDAIIKRNGVPNLSCIPAGTIPVNPAELLASPIMKETVDLLSQRFDYVIVDSTPVLGVADALILSTYVKGVVLIVHGEVTPRDLVQRAFKSLIELNAPVLGSIVNNVDVRRSKYAYYAYYKYYQYYHMYSDPSHGDGAEAQSHHAADDLPVPREGGR